MSLEEGTLIDLVEKYPFLWDKKDSKHKEKIAIDNSWKSISQILALTDNVTNKVISDNIDELFEDIRPVIDKVLTNILEDFLLKAVEGQVPFDKLYPPIP